MKNSQKNQWLNINKLLTLLCVVAGLGSLWAQWPQFKSPQDLEDKRAESLAFQILQMQAKADQADQSQVFLRGPASDRPEMNSSLGGEALWEEWQSSGFIGQDLWGKPYRYEVLKSSEGQLEAVHLWSSRNPKAFVLTVSQHLAASTN